jgi:hypothetical protein
MFDTSKFALINSFRFQDKFPSDATIEYVIIKEAKMRKARFLILRFRCAGDLPSLPSEAHGLIEESGESE